MTALDEYLRLEATGLWKEAESAQRREVIVSFGTATLVLSDINEVPLTHWSLAAVERVGTALPAVYIVGDDRTETLEIEDATMVDAIERVRLPLRPSVPFSGSLRLSLFLASALVAALFIWLWLPPALANYAARIIPLSKEIEIGNNVLDYVERFTGQTCSSEDGDIALARLQARVLPNFDGTLRVADLGAQPAIHLPGGLTLLHIAVIEDFSGPAVVSGYLLHQDAIRQETVPISDFLQKAGLSATIWFLSTGEIDETLFEDYARSKITDAARPPSDEVLIARFAEVQIPSTPYAYAIDPSGQRTKTLIDLDPVTESYPQILPDADWLAIQAICDPA